MENTNVEEKELVEHLDRGKRAEYLETHIKKPLEEVRTLLLAGRNLFPNELVDVVLLVTFSHIDMLGYLYTGDSSSRNSSKNAVQFFREYFGKVDARYKEVGGLLYDTLRHGLVHLATPKRIRLTNGVILDYAHGCAQQRQDHLKVTKIGTEETIKLFLDVDLLYQDLISAIDIYTDDIRHNQTISDIFWQAFEPRRRPARETELLRKSHIEESDFAFVTREISDL